MDITLLGGFPRAREVVAAGEVAAEKVLPRLQALTDKRLVEESRGLRPDRESRESR
jgi:hypothetical protein